MIKNCPVRHENGNCIPAGGFCTANKNICEALLNAYRMGKAQLSQEGTTSDLISRQAALEKVRSMQTYKLFMGDDMILVDKAEVQTELMMLPPAQPEPKWTPCSNPPKHHKDVIVRGIEAIGNVTVHKVMQWDVDTWRPTDYAPSIMWKEWSEI